MNEVKGCLGFIVFSVLLVILVDKIPELFIIIWFIVPILSFILLPVTIKGSFNYFFGIITCNFLSYFWLLDDLVKKSFGKKYITGFKHQSFDQEMGRYDISHTTHEYYIPDPFWSNIYEWFGTFFLIYSIVILSIYGNIDRYLHRNEDHQKYFNSIFKK
tara:strand:- start:65 stop:541 length:477 start_codon:yes stop_codon:yes gene_type:complete